MKERERRYVLISPVRNMEKYIGNTIECILRQSIPPIAYILVDTGSRDKTPGIIKEASDRYPFIHCCFLEKNASQKSDSYSEMEAFDEGYNTIETREYDYIGKMDGDLTVLPGYFEEIIGKFEADSFLGSASGRMYRTIKDSSRVQESHPDERIERCIPFFKRGCFDAIGRFVRESVWDEIAFHRIRMLGYRTLRFNDEGLRIEKNTSLDSSPKSVLEKCRQWGADHYFMGSHPLYIVGKSICQAFKKPYLIGGITMTFSYIKGFLTLRERYDYPGFQRSLNALQLERMKIGRRLEKGPPC